MNTRAATHEAYSRPPHLHSPLLALLWKEWRQQRAVFAALSLVSVVVLVLGWTRSMFHASGGAVLIGCLGMPVLLGANTFAGEHDARTSEFLQLLPSRPLVVFAVKFLVALLLCIPTPLILVGVARLLPESPQMFLLDQPVVALTMPFFFAVGILSSAALVGVTCRNVVGTVFGAIGLTAAGTAWLFLATANFAVVDYQMSFPAAGRDWLELFCLELGLTVALAASFAVSAHPPQALSRRVKRLVTACAACAAVMVVPAVFFFARYVFVLTPADYATSYSGLIEGYPSPSGEQLTAVCSRGGRPRVAFVDAHTGDWSWFSRFHCSNSLTAQGLQSDWSPNGRRYLLARERMPILPLPQFRRVGAFPGQPGVEVWLVDMHTGQSRSLTPPIPTSAWSLTWTDDTTVFSYVGSGMFWDVETGASHECRTPDAVAPGALQGRRRSWSNWRPVDDNSVFAAATLDDPATKQRALHILRFHPNLPVADDIPIDHTWEGEPSLRDVSRDGRCCLVSEYGTRPEWRRYWLVRLPGRSVSEIPPPDGMNWGGDGGARSAQFPRDGRRIVCTVPRGVACYDVETGGWTVWPLTCLPVTRGIGKQPSQTCSISPDGSHALVTLTPSKLAVPLIAVVVDLDTGANRTVWQSDETYAPPMWLGNDRIVAVTRYAIWVLNREGTGKRRLLPRE